jgi:hypothetical protein
LVRRQNADGSFSKDKSFVYNEAIATLALVEAYAWTHASDLKLPAQHAVEFLESAQRPSPIGEGPSPKGEHPGSKSEQLWGWRYASRTEVEVQLQNRGVTPGRGVTAGSEYMRELSDADTSATAWCVAALHAAREAGLDVRDEAFAGALAFTRWVTANDGLVGYLDAHGAGATVSGPNDHFTYHPAVMSAMGVSTRIACAGDPNDVFFELAAKRVLSDLPAVSADKLSIDYDYWYQGTRALDELDGPDRPRRSGKYWSMWNKAVIAAVTSLQDHGERSCRNGGWITPDRWSDSGGPIYSTAMSVLTLEVCFRDESAFGERPPPQATNVGAKAPDIRALDASGKEMHLAELAGSVVALDFWSTREIESKDDIAERSALLTRLDGKPFVLIGIALDPKFAGRAPAAVREHAENWHWLQATSFKSPLLRRYAVDDLPTTIVIDAEGVIRARGLDWSESAKLIETLVSEAEKKSSKK